MRVVGGEEPHQDRPRVLGLQGRDRSTGKQALCEGRLRILPTHRWLPAASPGAGAEVPLQAEEAAAA